MTALGAPGFLTDPAAARVGIALMFALQVGESFIIALAARRAIPERLYEAAAVESAPPGFVLSRLTLPLMAPLLGLLALRDLVLLLQVSFLPVLLLTQGGPRDPDPAAVPVPARVPLRRARVRVRALGRVAGAHRTGACGSGARAAALLR